MIFAAGLGTRLKPLTDTMPKALVPVAGKPLLQHVMDKLQAAGFHDLVVNVHHFAQQIINYLAGTGVSISDESSHLLETGGGIKRAAHLLMQDNDAKRFLIHNVDILSNVNLQAFWQAGEGRDATLLVSERDTQRYLIFDPDMRLVGWTNIKTGEVKSPYPAVLAAFHEDYIAPTNPINVQTSPFFREAGSGPYHLLAFAGIHQMSTSMLPLMDNYPSRFSIIDFYLQQCATSRIYGFVQPDLRLMDVGKLDTLTAAEQFLHENCE